MNGNAAARRRRAQRRYRFIVRLYPAEHRREFGEQMVQAFGDHYRDTVGSGRVGRWRFWRSVLVDAGKSLAIEHAAEIRGRGRTLAARRPRPMRPRTSPHPRDRTTRSGRAWEGFEHRKGSGVSRVRRARHKLRRQLRRQLRRRRSACRPVRVLATTRRHQLVYRGRASALVPPAVLVGAALVAGTVTGRIGIAAILAGVVVTAWLAYRVRLTGPVPAGPPGDGPAPPGGAGVREPRRPLPKSPAGSAARPRPDQQPPGQAVGLI